MRGKWKRACGIRGDAQRTTKKNQGPLSAQRLADNISKLSREQMEPLFNQMVQCVVGWGLLDGGGAHRGAGWQQTAHAVHL